MSDPPSGAEIGSAQPGDAQREHLFDTRFRILKPGAKIF